MHSLPIFVRLAGRSVILVGTGEAADAKRRLLERAGARIVGEEDQAALAIVADDDIDQDATRLQPLGDLFAIVADDDDGEQVAKRLKARGILVNVVDRPALCDFTLPAIVDRDPVLIAIGTGGASAGLAKALRQRLEALLPAQLGSLATSLHAAREAIRARWPDAADRRRAIDQALDPGGALDPLGQAGSVDEWLSQPATATAGALIRVDLNSADPDDLTLGQARLLGRADRVYHRAGVPAAILDRARADAPRIVCLAPPDNPGNGLSLDIALKGPQ